MSQENLSAFLRAGDAIARGDLEATLALAHPDIVFETQRSATEGAFVGHEGVRRRIFDTAETFELFRPDYTDVRDLGDRVLGIGTLRIRGRGSGVETDVPMAAMAEYRDGLLWRFKDYAEARLALEAAGLEE